MNRPVFYIVTLFFTLSLHAQENLVPNGSFEDYTQCPDDYGELSRAYPWYQPNPGSSDYYNACVVAPGIYLDVRVPQNSYGYQYPHTGNGYAGLGAIVSTLDGYEYLGTPLISPLLANRVYCVNIWISLADSSCLSVNDLGVYFSPDSIFSSADYHINTLPQIVFSKIVTDQENWLLLEDSFTAKGGEKYMAIGVFDTTGVQVKQFCDNTFYSSFSYYYIDDVSVKLASENCGAMDIQIPNVFTPNGDEMNDHWMVSFSNETEYVDIFNRWGNRLVHLDTNHLFWDGTYDGQKVSEGVYFYRAYLQNNFKTGFIQLVR